MTFNYIGSKKSLLDFIKIPIDKINIKGTEVKFLDAFAGTGCVGNYFYNNYNFNVVSNDMEYYSYIINYALQCVPYTDELKGIIDEFNNIEIKKIKKKEYNLIADNYSDLGEGESKRLFWTGSNAMKCDVIMYNINKKLKENLIDNDKKIFLVASLLSSMDKVANTASVYGAFLKEFKKTSKNDMILKPIHENKNIIKNHNSVYNMDVNSFDILNQDYDIVYLDPPYNQRQYSANYHPLNYIAKYDKNQEIYGKTGLLKDYNKSNYCITKNVEDSFSNLILGLKTKHILLSYNDEGLMSKDIIRDIMMKKGKVILYKKVYKKFKSQDKQVDDTVYEYLYHCNCNIIGEFEESLIE